MVGVRYSWTIGCDANMETKELSVNMWLYMLGAAIVAAGGSVPRYYDYFLVLRDLVDFVTPGLQTSTSSRRRSTSQYSWYEEQRSKR